MDANEKKSKPRSKEYPGVKLSTAIEFVEKLKDYAQNKPISYDVAAKAYGVKATTNSFTYTISAARQYGLILKAAGKSFSLSDAAKRFARPTESSDALRLLKVECFQRPKLYAELIGEYSGQPIPQGQTLENVLVNQYGIQPAVVSGAATAFTETAAEVGAIREGILDLGSEPAGSSSAAAPEDTANSASNFITAPTAEAGNGQPETSDEFAAPLNIPFGDKRRATLYMPIDAKKEEAMYVKEMIALMLKQVYGVE